MYNCSSCYLVTLLHRCKQNFLLNDYSVIEKCVIKKELYFENLMFIKLSHEWVHIYIHVLDLIK